MALQITDLLTQAKKRGGFNDIWIYAEDKSRKPLDTSKVTELLGKDVPGLAAFGRHGTGSLYVLWQDRVAWLDSEGEQWVIAKDVDDFVDAMLIEAGALWDLANSAQETDSFVANFRNGRHHTAEQLREQYPATWLQGAADEVRARYGEAAATFAAWATKHGRKVPTDIVDRMVALRPLTAELRALCSSAAPAPAIAAPPKKAPPKKAPPKKAPPKKRAPARGKKPTRRR